MRRHLSRPGRPSRRQAALAAGIAAAVVLAAGAVLVRDTAGDAGSPAPEGPEVTVVAVSPSPVAAQPEPVAAGERRVRRPVPLADTARFGTGLDLRVIDVEAVRGVARGPGEIAGPAVRLTVQLTNRGRREISLESVVLSVSYGPDRTPAMTLTGPDGRPFGGTLAPGGSQRARYVFAIPPAARDHVKVVASYTGSVPGVALTGSMS